MRRRSVAVMRITRSACLAIAASVCVPLCAQTPLPGTTITTSVTFDADLDATGWTGNVLVVGTDNITIDGANHKIIAPDAWNGISIGGHTGVTIKNLRFEGLHGAAMLA